MFFKRLISSLFHKAMSIWLITDLFIVDLKNGTWGIWAFIPEIYYNPLIFHLTGDFNLFR
jgi:hypothetical protein